jgi:hypothetical protein
MAQRQLRVGELVDDYCPRERRVSDHAIVAMVEDRARLVRCTTCDTEHDYRGGKVPPSRKKKAAAAPPLPPVGAVVAPEPPPVLVAAPEPSPAPEPVVGSVPAPTDEADEQPQGLLVVDGPVHRQLIRATLPRVDGQVPERRIPEFTMHNPGRGPGGGHGKPFRGGHGGPQRPGGPGRSASGGQGRPGGGPRQGGFSPQGGGRPAGQGGGPNRSSRSGFGGGGGGRPPRGKKG